jgi:chromosomal replication initiator protein
MYLAKKLTAHSFPRIGKLMGGKDHTTVLHGTRRIQAMLDAGNESLSDFISRASARLEGGD